MYMFFLRYEQELTSNIEAIAAEKVEENLEAISDTCYQLSGALKRETDRRQVCCIPILQLRYINEIAEFFVDQFVLFLFSISCRMFRPN